MHNIVKTITLVAASATIAATFAAGAHAAGGFSASVDSSGLPLVQQAGDVYAVAVIVRSGARAIPNLCLDFGDDNNSWLFRVPSTHAYDKDVFCYGRLRAHAVKRLVAALVPANAGQHKLEIGVGNAKVFANLNDAILDVNALYWSRDFVIT